MMDESDEEEEEVVVFLNFADYVPTAENLSVSDRKMNIIGIDTDTPLISFEPNVYKGVWTECIGTKVLLEESLSPSSTDPVFDVKVPVSYDVKYKTSKILELTRIFPNVDEVENEPNSDSNNIKREQDDEREPADK